MCGEGEGVVVIDRYCEDDKEAVRTLIIDVQESTYGEHDDEDELNDLNTIESTYQQAYKGGFWVARFGEERRIVGTIAVRETRSDAGMIKRLYVREEFRGAKPYGTASMLLRAVEQHVHRDGRPFTLYAGLTLEPPAAPKFYAKNGFTMVERESVPDGSPISIHDTHFYRKQSMYVAPK